MADQSRVIEVCEALADKIKAVWQTAGVRPGAEVSTDLVVELEWDKCPAKRTVYVVPLAYSDSPLTRAVDNNDYTIAIGVVNRKPATNQQDLSDWAKQEIKWFADNIASLSAIRDAELTVIRDGELSGTLYAENDNGVTVVYDKENLRKNKVFYSEFVITFREES